MSSSKPIVFSFLLLCCTGNALFACNCEPAPQLGAAAWNDADAIFTATLLEQKMGRAGILTFQTQTTYKGSAPPSLTFYFQLGKSHTLLHAVKVFKPGDEWIVFAQKKAVGNRVFYRLKESSTRTVCALSRPVREEREEDPYLLFLEEMAQKAEGYQKFYDEDGQLAAEGEYDGQIPIAQWTYYRPERDTKTSGHYIDGRREGDWQKVKERPGLAAQLLRKTTYKDGEPTEISDYRHTGVVSLKKVLTDSTEIRYYYRNDGSVKSKITEHLDNKTAHIINYTESEAMEEERFLENQRVVRRYWYDESGERVKEWVAEDG